MTSPVETIADALIAFIMSLLNDPEAADDFVARPQAMLAGNGLQGACLADVDAVRPVIVDHPRVVHHDNPPPPPPDEPGVVNEIVRMIQQYTTIDARSTIVDQSVNQNIWTEGGDVTQLFDQEAVVASGDDAIAAGDDVSVVDSEVDVSMGDVSIGNESNDGSFNTTGEDADEAAAPADAEADAAADAAAGATDAEGDDATASATVAVVDTAVDTATEAVQPAAAPPAPPADVPEPADLLESDMTSGGGDASYDADAAGATIDDQPVEAPLEDD